MKVLETSFYVTGGTLQRDAQSYVQRNADKELYEGLINGRFCYVLTSRQMGKSSLMVRTAVRLREENVSVAVLDLTAIGQNLTAEQWYDGLLGRIGQQLNLEDELEDFWLDNERFGPLQRWMKAIREVVLPNSKDRVVIFIDEIDTVRSLPFSTDEFFAGIREFYNRRTEDPELNRLTFCLLGVATPSDLIRDTRTTPFNIGERIELNDFSEEEAEPLARGFGEDKKIGKSLIKRVLYWTGGHPYLTQRLCQAVAVDNSKSSSSVDKICDSLFLFPQALERDDNLLFVRERILRSEAEVAGLLDFYKKIYKNKHVHNDNKSHLVNILRLSGITRVEGDYLRVRNRIYSHVFNKDWVIANMPDSELRRQRAAERRGLLRATAVSMVILAIMAGLMFDARNQRNIAQRARDRAEEEARRADDNLQKAKLSTEEANRASAEAESERLEAVKQREIAEKQKAKAEQEGKRAVLAIKNQQIAEQKRAEAEQQQIAERQQAEAERQLEKIAERQREINKKADSVKQKLLYAFRSEGFQALYNLDYQNARKEFEKMEELLPDHPAGYYYLATNLLLEHLNNKRLLQTDLYNFDSVYARNREPVDEKIDKEFRSLVSEALEKAETSVKNNPNDSEALYFEGASHLLLSLYEATVGLSINDVLKHGNSAVEIERKVIEIDPTFTDAYLAIGAYDFLIDYIPNNSVLFRIPTAIFGRAGSRDRGLENLQLVAEQGVYAKEDARVALVVFYSLEGRYEKSLNLLDSLSARYPRNYLFKLERANMLLKLDRAEESNRIFHDLLKDESLKSVHDLIHYKYGDSLSKQGNSQAAFEHYTSVATMPDANPELITRSHLRMGQLLDLLQRRPEAIEEYETVLKRNNATDSHELARKYLKTPFSQNAALNSQAQQLLKAAKAAGSMEKIEPPRIVATENDEFRKLRMEGFDAIYNMEYQTAKEKFERMVQLLPDHPAGHLYLATNFLFDQLNSRRRLQVNLYTSESFYSKNSEKIDEKTEQEFRQLTYAAIEKAEAAIRKNMHDTEAFYYEGAAYGLLALYETTVERSFFQALSNGRKSASLHRKVVDLDPAFTDAYLTIGTYDYIAGNLPIFIKLPALIIGISGSADRGLKEIQMVADKGKYTSDDARVALITLYTRERRYEEVLNQLDRLSEKYPRNYLFKLERANVLIKLNRAEESYKIFNNLIGDPGMKKVADMVHYQYGEALAGQKRFREAIEHFQAVVSLQEANPELVTRSHLRIGQLFDLLMRRTEALEEYSKVLDRDNVFDSHDQAKRLIKKPFSNQ